MKIVTSRKDEPSFIIIRDMTQYNFTSAGTMLRYVKKILMTNNSKTPIPNIRNIFDTAYLSAGYSSTIYRPEMSISIFQL